MSDRDATGPAPRPVPGPGPVPPAPLPPAAVPSLADGAPSGPADALATLPGRPVAEHVPVFEAELERLQRQLSTIDQL